MTSVMATRATGPAVERDVARDIVRRALPVAPVLVGLNAAVWGWAGAASSAFAVALVLANLVAAAALIGWAARISLGLLMAVTLFGFLVRLGLVTLAVLAVRDAGWVERTSLGLTLVVTHLGLLVWETRYVSASLAFPGLKPGVAAPPASEKE